MKKTILSIILLFFSSALIEAQNLLYATTISGGANNEGAIFYYNPYINKDSVVFSFQGSAGESPDCDLLLASNGLLYGLAYYGGTNNLGVLFSFNTNTEVETVLLNLDSAIGLVQGANDLIQGKDGQLYCCALYGGTYDEGTIFRYNISTMKDSVLFNFDSANLKSGVYPERGLYVDTSTGILYGVTASGGKFNYGTIFSFNPYTFKDSVLFSFDTLSGVHPRSGLIRASNGLLYGMTEEGGDSGVGVIYSYNLVTGIEKVELSF